ncbi:hypothetical protein KP509_29G073100 [Ceratopteris richardii]|uniref:Fucosyltransferase n=1 Tax=Ceratopteris richardii TaxID=49495 RepID=A0A8T2RAL7_CERRI|nr:hypothetical protein KP509_29G073100 [Ceratopteris richardii]
MSEWWRRLMPWQLVFKKSWLSCTALLSLLLVLLLSSLTSLPAHLPMSSGLSSGSSSSYSSLASPLNQSFTDLLDAYRQWDAHVGCANYRKIADKGFPKNPSLQDPNMDSCTSLKQKHVVVHVKGWTWLPDNLQNLYSCDCGLSCMWTTSEVFADDPDVLLFESVTPPRKRDANEPLRAYLDLEAGRKKTGFEDIFISYHAGDHIQATYAGASFHIHRSYVTSSVKRDDILVYWSSSRCIQTRDSLARELLSYLPHHSFGKCLNNVGGSGVLLSMYPKCRKSYGDDTYWAYHLHCAMSHYKFVLAIENTKTESYVTEKLFYALDAGAIPIYFGAPNVQDLVPPNSIIDGSKFSTLESLAAFIKKVADDPVLYAEYHAWRRCGIMGNYHQTRAVSLDSLPCRLCAFVSRAGGKSAPVVS